MFVPYHQRWDSIFKRSLVLSWCGPTWQAGTRWGNLPDRSRLRPERLDSPVKEFGTLITTEHPRSPQGNGFSLSAHYGFPNRTGWCRISTACTDAGRTFLVITSPTALEEHPAFEVLTQLPPKQGSVWVNILAWALPKIEEPLCTQAARRNDQRPSIVRHISSSSRLILTGWDLHPARVLPLPLEL